MAIHLPPTRHIPRQRCLGGESAGSGAARPGRARGWLLLALAWVAVGCSDDWTTDGAVVGPTQAVGDNGQVAALDIGEAVRDGQGHDAQAETAPTEVIAAAEDATQDAGVVDLVALPDAATDAGNLPDAEQPDIAADLPIAPTCSCSWGAVCFDPGDGAAPYCVADSAFACAPCVSDATCLGGTCSAEPDGKFCRIPCALGASGSSCPAGFVCAVAVGDVALRCQPTTGSCGCTQKNLGEIQACGGLGSCAGIRTCGQTGWSPCSGGSASPEACNGLDDDCDGSSDEGLAGQPCSLAPGPLCQGVTTCNPAGGLGCSAVPAASESCNGQDDDCDGQTDESVATVGLPCAVSNDQGSCLGSWICGGAVGLSCSASTPLAEACNGQDDDCDGATDEEFVTAGQYLSVAHCGSCATACALPSGPHAQASCVLTQGQPTCALACAPGWLDMDGSIANGCECAFVSDWDEPDGVDQNCDGMDGDESKGIFVSKTGADGNPGTRALPVASVAKGLELAINQAKRDVYIAGGVFTGSINLVAGISLYGGYGPGWSNRDTVQYQTALVGVAPAQGPSWALRCQGIAGPGQPTHVDGLTILAANAKAPGESSYGLLAIGCDDRLAVTWNQISAGDGAAGIAGEPGLNGAAGPAGTPGVSAKDIGVDICTAADHNPGGKGGQQVCGDSDVSGGKGGTAICPQMDEDSPPPLCPAKPYLQAIKPAEPGEDGHSAGGGAGGAPGADSYIDSNKGVVTQCKGSISCNTCLVPVKPRDGEDGKAGLPGPGGDGGAGGQAETAGSVAGGLWVASLAGTGGTGIPGSGGGGGGAAGGVEVHDCGQSSSQFSDIGGSGGGGGAGGCAGSGGLGGQAGGGSFAVSLVAGPSGKLPIFYGNALASGIGGAGAPGGPAGSGGNGGEGGSGGPSAEGESKTFCTSKGGSGGPGGTGGHGGGGGGGAGGPSALLLTVGFAKGAAAPLTKANVLKAVGQGGLGGAGGPSIGQTGYPGAKGMAKAWLEL